VLVFFARQLALTVVAILVVLIAWLDAPKGGGDSSGLLRGLAFAPLIVFEELGRYAFVRRAERPLRALVVFTVPIVAICTLFGWDDPYALGWEAGSTVLASAILYFGLRYRPYLALVVAGLIVAHMTIFMTAPNVDPARGRPPPPSNLAPVAPVVGDMSAWAKLYPGGAIERSSTSRTFGLTDWRVTYAVHASTPEIDAFYRQVAQGQDFKESAVFAGLRSFKRGDDQDEFSYMVWTHPDGSADVSLTARSFGKRSPGS